MVLKQRYALPVYFAAIGLLCFYFLSTWIIAKQEIGKDFRGFLMSRGLRVSEFRLPSWESHAHAIAPGMHLERVNGQRVKSLEEVERLEQQTQKGEEISYAFRSLSGRQVQAKIKLRKFGSNDFYLTHGVMTLAGITLLLCLIATLLLGPKSWRMPTFLYNMFGCIWFFTSMCYYGSHTFIPIFFLSGGLIGAMALHFNTSILDIPIKRSVLLAAYGSCLMAVLVHVFFANTPGLMEWLSFYAIWSINMAWSLYTTHILLRAIYNPAFSAVSKKRILMIILPQILFYAVPATLIFAGYLLAVKVPINQFIFLLSFFPVSIVILSYADKFLKENKMALKQMAAKERFVSLGVFSAGLAHEMNNPLHALSANSHALKRHVNRLKKENNPELKKKIFMFCDAVLKSMERIHGVVDGINAFSSGKVLVKDNLNFGELTRSLIDSYQKDIQTKKIDVQTSFPTVNDLFISKHALRQILMNLLKNSIDAVSEEGVIRIHATRNDQELRIIVRDNGPGIAAEIQSHVFEPFFSTKGPGEGMGLGLWICSQLISAQAGHLSISLPEEGGTIVEVTLPQDVMPTLNLPKDYQQKPFELPKSGIYTKGHHVGFLAASMRGR